MIDFAVAKTWHLNFALHVEFNVNGIAQSKFDSAAVCDDALCELGKWLSDRGRRYSHLPGYTDLVAKHKWFHRTAGLMLTRYDAGDRIAAQLIQSTSFRFASNAVLASIDRLASLAVALPEVIDNEKNDQGLSLWQDSIRAGMELIDDQHIECANFIERLNEDPAAPVNSESFIGTKFAVDKLAALHFRTEELFMREVGFPDHQIEEHVLEHSGLLERLIQIDIDNMRGISQTASEAYRIIRDKFHDHINNCDVHFREYVTNPQLLRLPTAEISYPAIVYSD